MPGPILSTWDVGVNQQSEIPFVMELTRGGEVEDEELINKRSKFIEC